MVVLSVITSGGEARIKEKVPYDVRDGFYSLYINSPEIIIKDYAEYKAFEETQDVLEFQALALGELYVRQKADNKYSDGNGYTDAVLYSELFNRVEYIERGYQEGIMSVCENSYKMLRQLENNDESIFARNYQKKVLGLYYDLPDKVELKLNYPTGWNVWFSSESRQLLVAVSAILIVLAAFSCENGCRKILRVSKYGGMSTSISKIVGVCVSIVCFSVVLCLVSLLSVTLVCGGVGDMTNAIQSVDGMAYVPYELTIFESFVISVVLSCVSALAIGLICCVFCSFVSSSFLGVCCAIGLFAVDYVMSKNTETMARMSIISIGKGKNFFSRYYAVDIFDYPMSEFAFSVVLIALLGVFCFVLSAFIYTRGRIKIKCNKTRDILSECKTKSITKLECKSNNRIALPHFSTFFVSAEARKVFAKKSVIPMIVVLMIVCGVCTYNEISVPTSLSEQIYKEYTDKYKGEVDSQKLAEIQNMVENYSQLIAIQDEQYEKYEKKQLSAEEYKLFLSSLYEAKTSIGPAKRLESRMQKLINTNGRIMYDSGYVELLNMRYRPIELLLVVLLGCLVFSVEYEGHCDFLRILRTARYGIGRTFLSKTLLVVILCFAFSIIQSLVEVALVYYKFGFEDLLAPLYSVGEYTSTLSIVAVMLIRGILCMTISAMAGCLSMALFSLTKNRIVTIGVTLGVYYISDLIGLVNDNISLHIDIKTLVELNHFALSNIGQMMRVLVIWLSCVAGSLMLAYEKYKKMH